MKKNEIFEKKMTVDIVAAGLKEPTEYILEASEKELTALAKRFEVGKIYFLKAHLIVYPGEIVKICGKLQALTCRECVISLEAFDEKMAEEFEVLCAEDPSVDSDEIIDSFDKGRIHLGEILAEQYGLALNPFPKKPGVKNLFEEKTVKMQKPFSDLRKIIQKKC